MIGKNQCVPFVRETHTSELQESLSIDGYSLISSNKSNGRKGTKEKKNELVSLLKRATPLFSLSFFDVVISLLSLPYNPIKKKMKKIPLQTRKKAHIHMKVYTFFFVKTHDTNR
jgi:hypothetical protein